MNTKTFGQIAYEASPEGGQQNWGPWENAPDVVKRVHEQIAEEVIKAFINSITEVRHV